MKQFTTYCSEEQTKKALKLGAPIEKRFDIDVTPSIGIEEENKFFWIVVPTTQQMIGWLREEFDINIEIDFSWTSWDFYTYKDYNEIKHGFNYPTYQEAELEAIDAALGYLLEKGE